MGKTIKIDTDALVKKFKEAATDEKVAYACVAVGILFVLVGLVRLFLS
ncbi:TPA: hypothetical protein HA249_05720 [Candidatus Woesearchaeota archaeon]|nr:hypothetical protein [Candidatus Woesearchaeota archaeon]HIH46819.1 hypothetical protein [Candidatus Woesearchaeota archaeon]HII89300.1 hypothetical protein [Candidatus Woesearchaeota archaeon]